MTMPILLNLATLSQPYPTHGHGLTSSSYPAARRQPVFWLSVKSTLVHDNTKLGPCGLSPTGVA